MEFPNSIFLRKIMNSNHLKNNIYPLEFPNSSPSKYFGRSNQGEDLGIPPRGNMENFKLSGHEFIEFFERNRS